MKSILVNYLYISANQIIKNAVILFDDKKIISIKPMSELQCEPAQTIFIPNSVATFFEIDKSKISVQGDLTLSSCIEGFFKSLYPSGKEYTDIHHVWVNQIANGGIKANRLLSLHL